MKELSKLQKLLNTEAVRTVVYAAVALAAVASFVVVYVRTGDLVAAGAAPTAVIAAVTPAIEKARKLVWSEDSHRQEVWEAEGTDNHGVVAEVPGD